MKSDEKLFAIVMDIYREAYKNAEPSADLDAIIASGEGKTSSFFMRYYLSQDDYQAIIDKHMKKNKCDASDKRKMTWELALGAAPCCVREAWEKARKEKP